MWWLKNRLSIGFLFFILFAKKESDFNVLKSLSFFAIGVACFEVILSR